MKRILSLFLAVQLLTGFASVVSGAEGAPAEDLTELTNGQAFAVAMACWETGFTEDSTRRIDFSWKCAGWYAA